MPSNEYMASYMAERYNRRRAYYIEKMGGACAKCGSTEGLEFDHIDASQKSFGVGKRMAGMAIAKLEAELAKCQLLCNGCHIKKSIVDSGKSPWRHGTISGYNHCRCRLCKEAKSKYSSGKRAERLAESKSEQIIDDRDHLPGLEATIIPPLRSSRDRNEGDPE